MGLKVGIDFGTSNSGVAYFDGNQVHLLPIDKQNVVPEVVKTILYITKDYQYYIGQEAVEIYYRHNINRLRHYVKKWVGEIEYRGADMFYVRDIYVYVDELKPGRLLQFIKTALRSDNYQGTQVFERYYTVVDIISAYLGALKKRAETILEGKIESVTLGRPVLFSKNPEQDARAEAMLRQSAEEAGFQQVEFEYEPVAAALYYETSLKKPQNVLIFDFGGGTLDLTVMRLGDPGNRTVYSSGGIGVAGSNFDQAIIQKRLLTHFGQKASGLNPDIVELIHTVPDWIALPELSTPQNRLKLEQAISEGIMPVRLKALESLIFNDLAFSFYNVVESGKIALSSQGAALLSLNDKEIDIWELYTRTQFEKDIQEFQEQIEKVLFETIIDSGLEPEEIDAVVKTGGSSNIPAFSLMLENIFGQGKVKASDIFSSVTSGLAIRAYQRS
ncbi:MAG: Hsp70 family protein [Omnitrophica WOR_2 bacterium]